MTTSEIVTVILGSSLIATIISSVFTYFFYRRQKNMDYEYDYRKYILEKRKEAYNNIENILAEITQHREYSDNIRIHVFIREGTGDNPIYHFNIKVIDCLEKRYWLSDKIIIHIEKLNMILMEMIRECNRVEAGTIEMVDIGNANFNRISDLAETMKKTYFADICELDDIKNFKNKKHI